MIRSARTLALAAMVVAITGAHAAAQPASGSASDPDLLEARGNKHYELAEYAAAIADFKEAFRITDQPELLFNIAQAYRLANDCRQALTFYRTYLRRVPGAANADKVRTRITEMEICAVQPAPAPAAPVAEPRPAPPPAKRVRTWQTWAGVGALAAGAIGTGLGVVFAARGAAKTDELRDACATACAGRDALSIEADGRAANRNATIGFVAGGALVAAGMVLIVLDRRGAETAPGAGPSIAISAGGASAGWAWGF